jgi:anti-sigma-K factor RskA
MMLDPHDDAMDATDPVLDALLRRADRNAPAIDAGRVEARIRSQAAFLLATRRRNARTSMADTLAVWVRVALPLAAAAALFAALTLSRLDTTLIVDAELSDSDPAALLSALESEGSSGLARHLIAPDAETQTPDDGTSR